MWYVEPALVTEVILEKLKQQVMSNEALGIATNPNIPNCAYLKNIYTALSEFRGY